MSERTKHARMSWRTWAELRDDLAALGVQIVEEECVQYYLDDHSDMIDAVQELCRLTREEFGPDATLSLSWQKVPGIPEGELRLLLRLPGYQGANVGERMTAIDEQYNKLGHDDRSGSLYLNTDFQPAR